MFPDAPCRCSFLRPPPPHFDLKTWPLPVLPRCVKARIKEFQEKRTAAEGSRRAKTAAKRSAQLATKRENKRTGHKAKKKAKKSAIAAKAADGAAGGACVCVYEG